MHTKQMLSMESRFLSEISEDCCDLNEIELKEDHKQLNVNPSEVIVIDYHVLWHCTYSVPVLLFQAFFSSKFILKSKK